VKLLLDTNVLLLWIVGLAKPAAIGGKRLEKYDRRDFDLVSRWAAQVPKHISTPHILAEVSNFLGSGFQRLVPLGTEFLAGYISELDEVYTPARDVVKSAEFEVLGLTDAAIHHIATSDIRVVSTDKFLVGRLAAKGVNVVNPWHYRTPS
jgi:hypothetical protein